MNVLKTLTIAAALTTLNLPCFALTITGPSPSDNIASGTPDPIAWGPAAGTSIIEAYIRANYGVGDLLYKSESGAASGLGVDEGTFAGSYKTTFSNTATDPSDALIKYVSGTVITGNPIYLLVKDGDSNPGWYLYSLNWNGTEDIILDDFWVNPEQGGISQISLYGSGRTNVPDGGTTAALLGLGVIGLAAVRRKS
jgi:hypothetical protein